MTPTIPTWASDNRYYMEEAFTVSAFMKNHLPTNFSRTIIANFRYGYLTSAWGIGMLELSDSTLKHFMENDGSILVLSLLSFKAPDRNLHRLTNSDYDFITTKANLIYNSNITHVFIK